MTYMFHFHGLLFEEYHELYISFTMPEETVCLSYKTAYIQNTSDNIQQNLLTKHES